ncbi:tetratricopeptide repeat protein [Acetobacter papayae]|uniref:tetratricopeptide repeat protein n=1 Tax=Acetobacter papayae TaxID=1076592 RepID=UPI00131F2358|nr:tetratricopeptide repeat protein [Acetobacter papayae]
MKPASPAPLSPEFLRACLSDIKAGLFWQALPRLEPYGQCPPAENASAEQAGILYAICLAAAGRPERAADLLAAVASRHPTSQHPLQDLAELLMAQDRRPEALAAGQALLRRTPDDTRVHAVLGSLLVQTGQHEAAISTLKQALSRTPDATLARSLLAMALTEQGDMQAALDCLHPLPASKAERAAMLVNIGTILSGQGRMEEALSHFDSALALHPDDARFHFNRSVALLKAGDYAKGWQEHEWRHALPGHATMPDRATLPALKGTERLDGKRVLLVHEEGLGDTLMYLRYIPSLAQRGAIIHLLVPPELHQLCQRLQGVHTVHVMRMIRRLCPPLTGIAALSACRVFSCIPPRHGAPPCLTCRQMRKKHAPWQGFCLRAKRSGSGWSGAEHHVTARWQRISWTGGARSL